MTTLPSRALDCLGDLIVPTVQPQGIVAAHALPWPAILFFGLLALFIIADITLKLLGLPTMSQWLQHFFKDHPWREFFAWTVWIALGWHLIRSFPWHWRSRAAAT